MSILDDYQWDAVKRLKNGSILCGDVGSGKSRTAIAYYFCQECGGIVDGLLFGYDNNWYPMKQPKALYIITTARKRDTQDWQKELLLFNLFPEQDLVTVDSWNNIGKYTGVQGAFFIFDEQRVVGSGQWVKSFLKITKQNRWILASATPGDKWQDYIPVFIANGFYKNRTEFKSEHLLIRYAHNFPIVTGYAAVGKLKRLRDNILVDMEYEHRNIRHNEVILCDYDIQKYKLISVERWNEEENRPILSVSEYYFLMRKCVNSDPSRGEMILNLLKDNPRLLIFYNFNYELEILKNLKYPEGYVIAEWNGAIHQPVPTGDRWVYLVQFFCVEGWNCTETDTCVFYSQNYSYKTMEQASGRIDRKDNKYQDLYYYHLRSRAPIDLKIARALWQKKKFNERSDFTKSNQKDF